MNYQESHLNRPKCYCCKQCIQVVNRSSRPSQIPWCPKSKMNHDFYKQNCLPDNENCHQRASTDYEEPGYQRIINQGGINQRRCMDHNTLRILSNLRQRARNLIKTSDLSDSEEYRPRSSRRTDTCPKERTKVPNIDYSPQSNYLKMMKERSSNVVSQCKYFNSNNSPDNHQRIVQPKFCHCSLAHKEVIPSEKPVFKNRTQHRSDLSSVHDACTCFKTWRLKNYAGTNVKCPDGGIQEICDHRKVYGNQVCDENDDAECEERIRLSKKAGHVSRKDKNKKPKRKPSSKIHERFESVEEEFDFKPSLKRPHPNSCERCWRYASPSRSPVNKPFQRFDPNYRRSHSLMNFDTAVNGKPPTSENASERDAETRAHRFTNSANQRLPKAKSAVHIKELQKSKNIKKKAENDNRKGKPVVQAKSAPERVTVSGKDSAYGAPGFIGDGSAAVCFCRKINAGKINNVRGPVQCSPSMFDKESRKSPKYWSRPSTAASSKSSKERRNSKQRPSSSIHATQSYNDHSSPPKIRPRSSDRRQLLSCNRSGLREVKENFLIPSRVARTPRLTSKSPQIGKSGNGLKCDTGINEVHEKATLRDRFIYDENCAERDNYSGPKGCICPNVNIMPIYDRTEHSPSLYNTENKSWQGDSRGFDDCRCCHCRNCRPSSPRPIQNPDPCLSASPRSSHRRSSARLLNKIIHSGDCDGMSKHYDESRKCLGDDRKSVEDDLERNPRKYCVFYMAKNKKDKDDDVEVLIEELTEGKCGNDADAKAEMVKAKMKKLAEHKLDSMALRFQKGISGKCRKYKNNRVLYF